MSYGPSSTDHGSVRLSRRYRSAASSPQGGSMRTHANRTRRARRVLLTFAAAALLAGSAVPAAAAQDEWTPPPGWSTAPGGANSSGVGFCLSQLAQFPEQSVGTSSAGEAISQVATSGPGAVPDTLEGARYPACAIRNLSTILRRQAELFTELPAVSNWAG